LALRQFLGVPLGQGAPDHSTLTNTRQRLPAAVFAEVFQFALKIAVDKKLVSGRTVGVGSTTLEANAAMKSIVRRDTGEDWKEYVTRLMRAEGVIGPGQEPTAEEVRRFDKKRANKTVSNADRVSETDAAARIAPLKDGRTHLAYKAGHVVDLESGLMLAAEVRPADWADTATPVDSVLVAQVNLQAAGGDAVIGEVAADKGYHAAEALELCAALGLRTYVPERRRRHRSRWAGKPDGVQRAVYANRRRVGRAKSKRLQRRRSEACERTFAHICDTGGARRSWLRGLADVTKRYVIAAAAHNLGRLLRLLTGAGKPKVLQGGGAVALLSVLWERLGAAGRSAYRFAARIWLWLAPAEAPLETR
jgi:hypothetical protein